MDSVEGGELPPCHAHTSLPFPCTSLPLPLPPSPVALQVDNEDLVFTLEVLVDKFGEQIAPYAVQMAQQLAGAFWKYAAAADEDAEGDDDAGERQGRAAGGGAQQVEGGGDGEGRAANPSA